MSFEGEIGEIDLIQRLVELGSEQFTGAIRFESDGIIKIVYFKGGDVLSASTNDRTDAIDEILLRANKVTREHVKQALAKRKESETLGDALLGLGFITRKELTWARRVQVIGILRSIIGWKTGSYTIVADYLPKREEGTLFPLAQIIVELIVTDTDRAKSEQAMESGNAVFEKAAGFDDAFRRLGLNEDAEQIAAQIDGSKSAAEIAAVADKDIFNVYKLLEALRLLGLITRLGKAPATHEVLDVPAAEVENPDFTLDDVAPVAAESSATMEMPALTGFDAPPEHDAFAETEIAPLPVAPPQAEPQWGFDEAQIETARRAEVPVRADEELPDDSAAVVATKPRRSILMPLLLLLVVAGAAYGGWVWWQRQQTPAPAVVLRPSPPRRTPPSGKAVVVPEAAPAAAPAPIVAQTTTVAQTAAVQQTTTVPQPPPPVTTTTNSPAAPVAESGDALRAKYDGMAHIFAAQKNGAYTLQFELVCETSSITRALAAGGDKVWFVPTSYRGKPCYRFFWGRFDSSAEAKAASKELPASLGSKPVVVKIAH
jgi:septal ring-binding cell division protein DamX